MITKEQIKPNKIASVAGILYLLMIPLGIFGIMYVPSTLIVPGDAATTANNIVASASLFRFSIVSALMIQLVQIFLVLTLYTLLKPVNKTHAALMVVFALAAVPIAMLNELNQIAPLLLLSGADYLSVFSTGQLQALVTFFFDLHGHGIFIAQIFWGLWLFPMGYLIFKSGFLPKILGILLMIGCFGYLIDSVGPLLLPGYELNIAIFTFWGELFLPLWLLIKGVNVEQWEKRYRESIRI